MRLKHLRFFSFVFILLLSCTLIANPDSPLNIPKIIGLDENGTQSPPNIVLPSIDDVTATPFLPLDPTARAATPTIVPTAPWRDFPGPSIPPSIDIPPPADRISQPADQLNFLLFGSDQRPNEGGFRTDTILLVTLSPSLGKVSITSFPRDLYVYIPGWTMQRINTAHPHGGFEASQSTFLYNFGFEPDFFAIVNFGSFVQLIDSLGGINVYVSRTLTDQRDGYGDFTVPAGYVFMDGETALWYARSRYTSSDFDRNRRQQEILIAIFYRIISLNGIQRAPELYNLFKNNIFTNATYTDLTPFIGLAAEIAADQSNLSFYAISGNQVSPYRTSSGAAVQLPNYELISETIRQALNAP